MKRITKRFLRSEKELKAFIDWLIVSFHAKGIEVVKRPPFGEDGVYVLSYDIEKGKRKALDKTFRFLDYDETEDYERDVMEAVSKLSGKDLFSIMFAITGTGCVMSEESMRNDIEDYIHMRNVKYDGTYGYFQKNWKDIVERNFKEKIKIELSPILKQYLDLKKKHPDALPLFRCGDFYETYKDDAVKAAKILGITLTKSLKIKDDEGKQLAMAGFPFHALDTYLPKLIRAGQRVAICDQIGAPKTTNKKE